MKVKLKMVNLTEMELAVEISKDLGVIPNT
jgi:hypothetical protein